MKGPHGIMLMTVAILSLVVAACGPTVTPISPADAPTPVPPGTTPTPKAVSSAGRPVLDTQWTTYTEEDGLVWDPVGAIAVAPDGAIWFSTGSGVSRFDGQTWTTYAVENVN